MRDLILVNDDRTRIARTLGRSREAIDRRAFVLGLTLPKGAARQPAN